MMMIRDFERDHRVRVIRKDRLWYMRALNWFFNLAPAYRGDKFLSEWITAFRLPFQKVPIIAVGTADRYTDITMNIELAWLLNHEMVHARGMRSTWGLTKHGWWLVTLNMWKIEQWAYLEDIRVGVLTPRQAANKLKKFYAVRPSIDEMIDWFNDNMDKEVPW